MPKRSRMPNAFWGFVVLSGLLWNGACDTIGFLAWGSLWVPMTYVVFLIWIAFTVTTAVAWPPQPPLSQDAQAKSGPPRPGNV